jgi:uncharacterized FAD-dependent dehydrogenase
MSSKVSENSVNGRRADVVIVGAGPAGLAAAAACKDAGVAAMVLERGKTADLRDRRLPEEIGEGIGGAGLFSDGKFSFYPSGTRLWELQPSRSLFAAYSWVSGILRPFGIDVPPFPSRHDVVTETSNPDGFHIKEYPSFRIPLDKRLELVKKLADSGESISTLVEVIGMRVEDKGILVNIRATTGEQKTEDEEVLARAVIVATGRLGAIRLLPWVSNDAVFRRLEVGVRIEQSEDAFFLRDARGLDPKLIAHERSGVEWRTFCCCRAGEVVEVLSNGILAVAGRSDISSTRRSNIAFHVRITDPELGRRVASSVLSLLDQRANSFSVRVDNVGNDLTLNGILTDTFGAEAAEELVVGLRKLQHEFDICGPVTVHGPAVEGVGFYPRVGPNLQMTGVPVWLPGDVAGLFRGLTAALVSGYFVGRDCAEYICP